MLDNTKNGIVAISSGSMDYIRFGSGSRVLVMLPLPKRIYDIVLDGDISLHEIKALGGFGKEDKSQFDRAMAELQMGMFITMTGRQQKKNKYGIEYGWNSTVFTTAENFWAERDFEIPELDAGESYEKIRAQILRLNPMAEKKTIRKFIMG